MAQSSSRLSALQGEATRCHPRHTGQLWDWGLGRLRRVQLYLNCIDREASVSADNPPPPFVFPPNVPPVLLVSVASALRLHLLGLLSPRQRPPSIRPASRDHPAELSTAPV